jgi:hypothetical protein
VLSDSIRVLGIITCDPLLSSLFLLSSLWIHRVLATHTPICLSASIHFITGVLISDDRSCLAVESLCTYINESGTIFSGTGQ